MTSVRDKQLYVHFLRVCLAVASASAFHASPTFHVLSPAPCCGLLRKKAGSSTKRQVFERMSEECVNAIVTAQKTATRLMLDEVDETCMLVGCVDHPETRALERTFAQYRVTYRAVTTAHETRVKKAGSKEAGAAGQSSNWLAGFRAAATNDNDRQFSRALKSRFKGAGKLADQMKSAEISTHHLLLSLLGYQEAPNQPPQALADGVDESANDDSTGQYEAWHLLRTLLPQDGSVTALQVCESLLSNLQDQSNKSTGRKGSGPELVTGVGSDAGRTPTLADVGTDLTQLARDGLLDPVFARDAEIRACLRTLLRRRKNNVILLGEPGTGKTAIAEGVAQLLVSDECPPKLKAHRLVSLELASLVAGTKYRGEFEERLQTILDEVLNPKAPPTILFVDEIHNLVGAGAAEGGMDAANLLKPALARGEMQLIGATTISEYRKYIEKDGALERRLQPVMVRETSVDQTVGILKALQSNYEQHHGVVYTNAALYAAATLSERYISDRFLPDKAIDLVDEAGAVAHLEVGEGHEMQPIIDEQVVAKVVAEMTGIPVGKLESTEMERLQSLESELEGRVKGQRRAVRGVARAIRRARSGLRDPNRPVASFLLCGGTGTGKTELCRTLAETYYGSEKDMIRIDMSEYMDKHTVSRLVGSPPGFIGYDEGGQLTEKVRKMPHSVVLLDEIEKAHDDVLNILLQIMEDGVLTDGKGRTVSFKNTVLVMTSNIGSHRILELARRSRSTLSRDGASEPMMDVNGVVADLISDPPNELNAELGDEHNLYPQLTQVVKEELEARMKPELLNRIDEIVVFSPLRRPELIQIASLIVNRLVDRAVKEQDLQLTVGSCVLEAIVQEGSEKADQFGARPMRRAAQRFVEDTLSDAIIRGFLSKGDEATLTLKTNQLAVLPLKQNVVLTRKRDGQELVVEVEDSNGGIDGVTSSPYGRVTESGSLAETSRSRN